MIRRMIGFSISASSVGVLPLCVVSVDGKFKENKRKGRREITNWFVTTKIDKTKTKSKVINNVNKIDDIDSSSDEFEPDSDEEFME